MFDVYEPISYNAALRDEDNDKLRVYMAEEMLGLREDKTGSSFPPSKNLEKDVSCILVQKLEPMMNLTEER